MTHKTILLGLVFTMMTIPPSNGQVQNRAKELIDSHQTTNIKQLKSGQEEGSPQHIIESEWLGQWILFATEDLQYRVDGMPLVSERTESDMKTRELYGYGEQEQSFETIYQEFVNDAWYNLERVTAMLDDDEDYLGFTSDIWQDGEWKLNQGMQLTHQKTGSRIDVTTIRNMEPGAEWTNMQRYTYTYADQTDRPAVTMYEIWENGAWVTSFKTETTYDGNTIEEIQSSFLSDAWMVLSKMITEMGENGSKTIISYNPVGTDWIVGSKTTYLFDAYGNSTLYGPAIINWRLS